MERKGFLYILQSVKSGRHYLGSTMEPDRRLKEHNANSNNATRNKGPWERRALLQFPDLQAAKKAEAWLKRMKSKRVITLVASNNFEWKTEFQLEAVIENSTE